MLNGRTRGDMKVSLNVEKSSASVRFESEEQRNRKTVWEKRARQVSYVSITITLLFGFVGLITAIADRSVALLGYSLESFVDVWSSILVLWRFWSSSEADAESMRRREKQASVGIAFTFVGIGVVVGGQAVDHLAHEEGPMQVLSLVVISSLSTVLLSLLFCWKMVIARQLQSITMEKDATTSGAIAVLSLGVLVSASIYHNYPQIWWIDSLVAAAVAMALFIAGLQTLIRNDWWSRQFWAQR
eukprot:TRINITY_DN54622_c0_g1_i2.p2 TRINITY_DN54622_c0_g1~~TRINITY_DN54622_c0_g1_i2.p2  ORF type:complete len:243 (-),score=25.89 TRINITY_DN54622_c0_g1_i2:246-974(-)